VGETVMGVIEFIELSTQDGQVLDHFGLTNADCPMRTVQLELVSPYWSYQFAAYYSAKSL